DVSARHIVRIRTDEDRETSRLDDLSHLPVVKRKRIGAESERDCLRLARPQRYSANALEGLHWLGSGGYAVADVKLNDFVAGTISGIPDVDRHRQTVPRSDPRRRKTKIGVSERRVAQAVSERIQWCPRQIEIFRRV